MSVVSELSESSFEPRLFLTFAKPIFLRADVEEVFVGVLACWVVRVHVELLLLVEWLLNIPENVRWNSSEDFESSWGLQALAESLLQIFDVVVLFSFFENRKFFIEVGVPFIKG